MFLHRSSPSIIHFASGTATELKVVHGVLGRYRIVARSPDGEEHHVSGEYREVVPNEKLVFTWAWRSTPERVSLVTLHIRPDGEGARLTLVHEQFFDEPARDRHRQGWTGSLDKLEKYLAS